MFALKFFFQYFFRCPAPQRYIKSMYVCIMSWSTGDWATSDKEHSSAAQSIGVNRGHGRSWALNREKTGSFVTWLVTSLYILLDHQHQLRLEKFLGDWLATFCIAFAMLAMPRASSDLVTSVTPNTYVAYFAFLALWSPALHCDQIHALDNKTKTLTVTRTAHI